MEEKKKCSKCGQEKPATNKFFNKNVKGPNGLDYWCKLCKSKQQKDYREKKLRETGQKSGDVRPKKITQRPCSNRSSIPKIDDAILLDQQILKAIKKSVANQIIKIIEEAFA